MKLWLAPLHGITDYRFRNLFNRHFEGVDAAIAPFVPVMPATKINPKKWKDLLPENNQKGELVPQLMGNTPDFLDTVMALSDLGYSRFNWNLGCPAKEITRKKRGCGLMPYPEIVTDILSLLTSKTHFSYSVKIRLGLNERSESVEMVKRLNDYPLESVIIHPRLGVQQYDGVADVDAFAELLSLSQHEVIYNGDIVDISSFEKVKRRFPTVNQWMIGRGLLQNPFLAEEIKKDNLHTLKTESKKIRFARFYDDLLDIYSKDYAATRSDKVPGILKELWHYFSVFSSLFDEELTELLRVNGMEEFRRRSRSFFPNIET